MQIPESLGDFRCDSNPNSEPGRTTGPVLPGKPSALDFTSWNFFLVAR